MIVMGWRGLAGSSTMSTPYYRQIVADVRARIASGEWPPGHKLPSTSELIEVYKVSLGTATLAPSTLRHAIGLLIELGELRGQQGLGVFVADAGSDKT